MVVICLTLRVSPESNTASTRSPFPAHLFQSKNLNISLLVFTENFEGFQIPRTETEHYVQLFAQDFKAYEERQNQYQKASRKK